MRISALCSMVLACGLLAVPAGAQTLPDPAALRQQASQTSNLIEQYRGLLRDPDANLRLGVFLQLVEVADPVVRTIAYEEGFSSGDSMLRNLAMKLSLFDRTHIVVEFEGTQQPAVALHLISSEPVNGEFGIQYMSGRFPGRVEGSKVTINLPRNCVAQLELDDADMLTGEWRCSDGVSPIRVNLRGL